MAAAVLTQFDSTPANIVADLKALIVAQGDWTNITGDIVKATSDGGAQLVVNLAKAAAGNTQLNMSAWRTHDGVTGVDEKLCYLPWKRTTGATSASSDPVHVKVAAGKNGLYIEIEGPRGGETNAESATLGSARYSFYLGDLTSYWDGTTDPVDACVLVANTLSTGVSDQRVAYVSRNAANGASWVPAYLFTLSTMPAASLAHALGSPVGLDGKTYLTPWVVWEVAAGIRGRLTDAWCGGPTTDMISSAVQSDPVLREGQRYTYGGDTFQLMATVRNSTASGASSYGLPWAPYGGSATNGLFYTSLVAIPVA